MTYEQLPVGQKINIKERESDRLSGRTRVVRKRYTVAEKYPHMCIVRNAAGSRRGLSMGDLIINGIIEQKTELEALKKEPFPRAFRKRGR